MFDSFVFSTYQWKKEIFHSHIPIPGFSEGNLLSIFFLRHFGRLGNGGEHQMV